MPGVLENMSMVRGLLDDPDPHKPSDPKLFQIFGNQVAHHLSQLQNSGAPWSVFDWQLTTSAGEEDYLIAAPDFGKPFWVHTEDPSDPYRARVEVPFCLLQNADQFYAGPRQVVSTSDNVPSATVISFYNKSGSYYARITPVPGGTAYYRIWYEVAPVTPGSLSDSPGLTSFHHLIRVQAAVAALPYCQWGEIRIDAAAPKDREAWGFKTKALGEALAKQELQFQKEFSTYIGTLMQPGVEARDGFGPEALDEWGWGVGIFGPNSL
jgi:hypothetical protein